MVSGKPCVFAYVCTDGYTERGAMDDFLNRLVPEKIRWVRIFPAKSKPGPKRRECDRVTGSTGSNLVSDMMERLRKYGDDPLYRNCDAIMLVDDADCRFRKSGDERTNYRIWVDDQKKRIEKTLGRTVHFFALFASPEVEAWFVADWERGFLSLYSRIGPPLKMRVNELLEENGVSMDEIEKFGAYREGACSPKLSEKIAVIIEQTGMRYSKKDDGPELLAKIRPDAVAAHCAMYFGPTLREIERFASVYTR